MSVMSELTKEDFQAWAKAAESIVNTVDKLERPLNNPQVGYSNISMNFSGYAVWAAITVCIVVAALSYQSSQFLTAQINDQNRRIDEQVVERKRENDRNQDYFNMHKSNIDQLKLRLDQLTQGENK